MDCYKKFAQIYDKLINEDIDYLKWSNFILKLTEDNNINMNNYLDLACGTGNMTEKLAKNFKKIWAIDLSSDMLMEAEEKLRLQNIKANFVCQDISNLNLNRKFDLITCCLDSTNYILYDDDIKNYFSGVYNLLNDNGIFVFDINSYYKLTNILGNNIFNYDDNDVFYVWDNSLNNDIVDMYLTFFVKDGQVYKRFDENHTERAYKDEYIEKLLNNCNLEVLNKYDNYTFKNIDKNSERITYVVRKQCN